ncbi:MAG: carboxypeptidase-like regulatory domain-containing protein [Verrucomicrobiales bacterium]|nr:carboxypeptidase-like regulatory domain-containing protein [Verrucomicrobiales bacterium]
MGVLILLILLFPETSPVREWVIEVEKSLVHRLQGVVSYREDPVPGIKVEVYDNGEVILQRGLTLEEMRGRQRIVATTTTDERGRFKLRQLLPGKYELHFEGEGWNPLSVVVTVVPRKQKVEKRNLIISMPLGG